MEYEAMWPARSPHASPVTSVRGIPADRLPWALDDGWVSISPDGHDDKALAAARHARGLALVGPAVKV